MVRTLLAVLVLLATFLPGHAVNPDEVLDDPALEARARVLSAELRCLVCQNQSIDASDAPLAKDLRVLLRERLKAGDSDSEVMKFLVDRYGEFILLRPSFGGHTLILWLLPFGLLILGAGVIFLRRGRREVAQSESALSDEDQSRLKQILD